MSHFFTSLAAYNTQRIQMNLCQYGFFILKTKHFPTFSNAVSLDRSLSYFWTVHFHTSGPSSLILSDRPLFSPGTIHLCLKDLPLSSVTVHLAHVTVHFGSLGPSTLNLTQSGCDSNFHKNETKQNLNWNKSYGLLS